MSNMGTNNNADLEGLSQQELLRTAMKELGLTREGLAGRIHAPLRSLNKWLLPPISTDYRPMPDLGKAFVRDIITWQRESTKNAC
ncbi:transcriptional regulator [Burkholderia contaminans]|uniref:transcriptional regulator n=1 Tax=Burkholderia contaminans TaxID=488447 RepID=UPI001F13648E|nr:transcriptional regulator [Burkholderia contaminans]UMY33530.1 transcriptional regulator [Burkholderia contaminans]